MTSRIDLDGRHAVITGAASGLGDAALALFLESGASVTAWDLDEGRLDALAARHPGAALDTIPVDVTDWESVSAATATTLDRHGRIDILVNSAGIPGPALPVQEYPIEAWDRVIGVNLTGVFYCCRAVVPPMVAAGYGRIVNFSSISAKAGGRNQLAYVATKGAMRAMTLSLGNELAGTGVLVNCIAPGAVDTPMYQAWRDGQTEDTIRRATEAIPLGRVATPEEAARTIAWMSAEDMSYTTGYTFDLTGGRAVY